MSLNMTCRKLAGAGILFLVLCFTGQAQAACSFIEKAGIDAAVVERLTNICTKLETLVASIDTATGAQKDCDVDSSGNCTFPGIASVDDVSGQFKAISTPTVQNAAYAASNCIGGFNTLTAARVNGGGILLTNFSVRSVTGITPTIQVYIFDSNPTASTCTDKSTFTLNVADISKVPAGCVFQVALTQPQGSTPSFGAASGINCNMLAAAGTQNIYYALVATAAMTPGSTTDLQVSASGIQD
jgi:hypothetical protein